MSQFKRIYIEITNVCNLTCSFCPTTYRTADFMSFERFKEVLRKIKGHGKYLYLHVKGEPLLHPQLASFLGLCHENGYQVNLTTNGTLLYEAKDILFQAPALRQLAISLQSLETANYDIQRSYMEQVIDFVKEAQVTTNLYIDLRLWNLSSPTELKGQQSDNSYILAMLKEGLELEQQLPERLTGGKGIKLKEHVYLSMNSVFEWPQMDRALIGTEGFCYGLRQQVGILVDGTVIPCCLDSDADISLGNIFEVTDFSQIIGGDRAKNILNGFSNRNVVEPLCQRCGYRTRFNK